MELEINLTYHKSKKFQTSKSTPFILHVAEDIKEKLKSKKLKSIKNLFIHQVLSACNTTKLECVLFLENSNKL